MRIRKIYNKSFTLIELLIVLVIIGIISSLAIPQYKKWVRKAQAAEAKQVLRAVSDSLDRYHMETGSFPPLNPAQGYTAIPTCLNIQVPESKYFTYRYATRRGAADPDDSRCYMLNVDVIYKDWMSQNENTICGYAVLYLKESPATFFDFITNESTKVYGQKLDNTWYKYFLHYSYLDLTAPGVGAPDWSE